MKCEDIQLSFAEILSNPENHKIETEHISTCDTCREELTFYKMMQASFQENFDSLSTEESLKNQSRILSKIRKNSFRKIQKYIISAAAVLVLLFGSIFNLKTSDSNDFITDDQWILVNDFYSEIATDINDDAILDYLTQSDDIDNLEELLISIN